MSTEVEQQPAPAVVPVVVEENGAPAVEATTTAPNGETKTEEVKQNGKAKKEPEPPKDIKEDSIGWLNQQNSKAVHKANYLLASNYINKAYPEEDPNKPKLPESGFVKKSELTELFKDGVILARFANAIKPGVVEQIKEGEDAKTEENQKANIDAFNVVAKEYIPEEQLFTYDELKKGKAEFDKVFKALVQLLFKTEFPELDSFLKEISEVEPEKFLNKIAERVSSLVATVSANLRKPFNRSNSQAEQPANGEQNGVHTNGTTETTHEENGAVNGTKVEEKKEEATAVAAN